MKVKCTQFGFVVKRQAFKNARVMFFLKLGGAGNNFQSGSKISIEGCPNLGLTPLDLTPLKFHAGVFTARREPPPQPFEIELLWFNKGVKYKIPKNNPLKLSQYSLLNAILDHLISSFQITHSYFSSPTTCPNTLKQFYSPFLIETVFGSLKRTFQHKWQGHGYGLTTNTLSNVGSNVWHHNPLHLCI